MAAITLLFCCFLLCKEDGLCMHHMKSIRMLKITQVLIVKRLGLGLGMGLGIENRESKQSQC